jgi:hypothetical protein
MKLNNERTLVFEPAAEILVEPEVSEKQSDFSDQYLKDWIQALQHSIRSNAAFQAGITSDLDSNRHLGRILEGLTNLAIAEAEVHAD